MKIELTKSQCKNLSEFIEMRLIDEIREDDGIDNFDWVRDMVAAKEALDKAVAEYEDRLRPKQSISDSIALPYRPDMTCAGGWLNGNP